MSAFVVSDKHINAMITFGNAYDMRFPVRNYGNSDYQLEYTDDLQRVAEVLKAENVRSVCARYRDESPDNYDPIVFQFTKVYEPIEILKACMCYDYQCCETYDWKTTEAHLIMEHIMMCAITELPGYEEADWAIC